MAKIKTIILSLLLLSACNLAFAQTDVSSRQESSDVILQQCQQAYRIGQFDEAVKMLTANFRLFGGNMRVRALRLLALCSICQDDWDAAERYTDQLLKEDPLYNTVRDDNQRFIDMVERKKRGVTTVISASQLAEDIEEAPVPTTLITEEMIRHSGAKNLAELLCLYVPGMSIVEGADMNVTVHGAYSLFQEKILVMLNGQRLNSRVSNAESLDYRNSLDKIKQIEVLRGPASSLYGNVALTAVVNIITKQGSDVDGIEIKGGVGNNKSYLGSILFGKRFYDIEFFTWVSGFMSDGERREINPTTIEDTHAFGDKRGYMYLNGYNDIPSYDFGAVAKFRHFSFMLSQQRSKKVTPYTNVWWFGNLYDYDRYNRISGSKPGLDRENLNISLKYDNQWNNLFAQFNCFFNKETSSNYSVLSDKTDEVEKTYFDAMILMLGFMPDPDSIYHYAYQCQQWLSYTFGASAQLGYNYHIGRNEGTLLGGLQLESFTLADSQYMFGENDSTAFCPKGDDGGILGGSELTLSGYLQLKQRILRHFILSGGIRYDFKRQYNGTRHHAFSPRVSLFYNVNKYLNLKASYAHSFVDAPYLYRANNSMMYLSGAYLSPETMDGLQFAVSLNHPTIGLNFECNAFCNLFNDIITFDNGVLHNAGAFKIAGVENVLSYKHARHTAMLNVTYQHVLDYDSYLVYEDKVFSVPKFMGKLMYNFNALNSVRYGTLDLHANLTFNGTTNSKNYRVTPDGVIDALLTIPGKPVVNAGVDYSWRAFALSCNIYNVFNQNANYGSTLSRLVPIMGRNFMLTLKANIK